MSKAHCYSTINTTTTKPVAAACRRTDRTYDGEDKRTNSSSSSWLWRLYLSIRCIIIFAPWLVHLLLSDVLLSFLLPISTILPDLCYGLSSRIAESVWLGIQHIFTQRNHADIVVSGVANLPKGESAIVVANHVSWTDFYMIQQLAITSGMLSRCRWFAKRQLKWVPFLGWGLWAMGMPLVSRTWMADQQEMARVFRGPLQRQWPMWLISYSEATRYTSEKRQEAEAWCKSHHKRLGLHVLYPRTKGFIACVQNLRAAAHVQAVYDVTVAYAMLTPHGTVVFQLPPTFSETVLTPRLNERYKFFVHVERFSLDELPETDEALALWLEDRWVEKGQRLERLRQRLAKGMLWSDMSLAS